MPMSEVHVIVPVLVGAAFAFILAAVVAQVAGVVTKEEGGGPLAFVGIFLLIPAVAAAIAGGVILEWTT